MAEGIAGADTIFNEAVDSFDRFHLPVVKSMTTTAPPGSPSTGDGYVIPTGATGVWSGNVGKVTIYGENDWIYKDASAVMQVFDEARKGVWCYSPVESEWYPRDMYWSTTEHWTGRYFGGSKVYAKVLPFGALPNNTTKNHAHGITGLDFSKPISPDPVPYMRDTVFGAFPIPTHTAAGLKNDIAISATNFSITTNWDASALDTDIRLLYCKT